MQLIINETFKRLLPYLSDEQLAGLEQDILTHGCLQPLITWNGFLVDGFNRYAICTKHGISFTTKEMQFENETEAKYWCWLHQKNRRNLSRYEECLKALEFEELFRDETKERRGARTDITPTLAGSCEFGETRDKIAGTAGISHGTLGKVKLIKEKADSALKMQLKNQDISINKAYQIIKDEESRAIRIKQIAEISKNNAALNLPQKYAVVYADPPWRYSSDGIGYDNRAIENNYPTMEISAIKMLPVKDLTLENAILFLWTTSTKLEEAFEVVAAWGFGYRTCAIWDKQIFGMGSYFRQQHELLLVAKKGNIPSPKPEDRPPSVISQPKGKRSVKPTVLYEVVGMCGGIKFNNLIIIS